LFFVMSVENPSPAHQMGGRPLPASTVVLAEWYAAHPSVRRLWAIGESQRMRIVVTLEPTPDSDDLYPSWLANGRQWAHELQSRMEVAVHMEVVYEPVFSGLAPGIEGVLVAEIHWRDPSMQRD
jgi:hypothetical protein